MFPPCREFGKIWKITKTVSRQGENLDSCEKLVKTGTQPGGFHTYFTPVTWKPARLFLTDLGKIVVCMTKTWTNFIFTWTKPRENWENHFLKLVGSLSQRSTTINDLQQISMSIGMEF